MLENYQNLDLNNEEVRNKLKYFCTKILCEIEKIEKNKSNKMEKSFSIAKEKCPVCGK